MDEHQSIIALGAGGISKVYYPSENRLERVANVTNYQEYIKRIDEMLNRKEKNIFMEVKEMAIIAPKRNERHVTGTGVQMALR